MKTVDREKNVFVHIYSLNELHGRFEDMIADGVISLDEKEFVIDVFTSINKLGYKEALLLSTSKEDFKKASRLGKKILNLSWKQIRNGNFIILPLLPSKLLE